MNPDTLQEEFISQKKKWQITIPAKNYSKKWSRNRQFKITKDNKPRVNLKHLAHHTLLQIVCVDDLCDIYLILKKKQQRYPIKMHQSQND